MTGPAESREIGPPAADARDTGTRAPVDPAASYPLVLDGQDLVALIVGGGDVAARKAEALLAAGAQVRIIAASVGARCRALEGADRISIEERVLADRDIEHEIGDALLVVAATDAPYLNARIAEAARRMRRLVNVVDAPGVGNCITPATHRIGGLTVSVSAGGVPAAAARIRDAIAARFDERYSAALTSLAALREQLLAARQRERWRAASDALLGDDFCESVEQGRFTEQVARWR